MAGIWWEILTEVCVGMIRMRYIIYALIHIRMCAEVGRLHYSYIMVRATCEHEFLLLQPAYPRHSNQLSISLFCEQQNLQCKSTVPVVWVSCMPCVAG